MLLRGGAIGAIVMAFCLIYMPPENASLRALAIPLTNVPVLALAYYHLFRPAGMTFEEGFGLGLPWGSFEQADDGGTCSRCRRPVGGVVHGSRRRTVAAREPLDRMVR